MSKRGMSALMGIILFVMVFVIVLAMYLQLKVYSEGSASSSTCSFTGSLRSFQNNGPVELVTPDTKLACQTYDIGKLTKYGEDDFDIKNNYIKQVEDMMYDCSSQFDFGKNNVWLRDSARGVHCFPCYTFYLPEDAMKISSTDMEVYAEQYEIKKEGKEYNMSDLLFPVLMPVNGPSKDYFVSEVSMPWIDVATGNDYFKVGMIVVDVGMFIGSFGSGTAVKKIGTELVKEGAEAVAKNVARKQARALEKKLLKEAAKKESDFFLRQAAAEATHEAEKATAEYALKKEALKKSKLQFAKEIVNLKKDAKNGVVDGMVFVVSGDYLLDNKGLSYETFDYIEPKQDYVVVFISKVKEKTSSYEPGISDDGNYVIIAKSKDFSKLGCQNEND